MSNQTGFDYEVMISRLHGGLCAFQSLRAHRRERAQAAAPPPATEARRMPEPQPAARIALDDLAELHATASLAPQAFVAVGDRVVPLFGSVSAGMFGVAAAGPATTPIDPPATPPSAPAPATAPTTPPVPCLLYTSPSPRD